MNPILGKTMELLTCDKPSLNGYIYPIKEVKKAVEKYQEKIKANEAFGTLEIEPSGAMNLENISHKVTKMYIEGDKVMVEILDTPLGFKAKDLFDGLKLSSVGFGTINDKKEVHDYNLDGTYFSVDYEK